MSHPGAHPQTAVSRPSAAAATVDPAFWAGKRVFLTGHTGFKGGWLTVWLTRLGASVSGYALAPEQPEDLYVAAGLDGLAESEVADIRDRLRLAAALRRARPNIVFHLAAQPLVRRSYAEPVETFATNVMGTVHLLEACRDLPGLEAVVVITTDKVYENADDGEMFAEDDPLGGAEPYGYSKAAAEMAVSAWRRAYFAEGMPRIASARAGNVIGGGDWSEDRLVPDAMRAFNNGVELIVRSPGAVRPWQHVAEPLAGYLVLAERLAAGEAAARGWNFGPAADQCRPVRELADMLATAWGGGAAWRAETPAAAPHEAASLLLDSGQAARELGWRSALSAQAAVRMTVEWYRAWAGGAGPADLQALMAGQIDAIAGAEQPAALDG